MLPPYIVSSYLLASYALIKRLTTQLASGGMKLKLHRVFWLHTLHAFIDNPFFFFSQTCAAEKCKVGDIVYTKQKRNLGETKRSKIWCIIKYGSQWWQGLWLLGIGWLGLERILLLVGLTLLQPVRLMELQHIYLFLFFCVGINICDALGDIPNSCKLPELHGGIFAF